MRSFRMPMIAACLLAFSLGTAQSQEDPALVAPTGPRTPDAERSGFHLPPGFEIQLVASDPDIHKPMNIAFDDRGRLWVTETIEYPFPAAPGKTPRDSVKILEDFGPDGKARKITTFADGLNIPIGLLPMPGGNEALIHAIPTIDRFTDTDGDGKADKRELAYKTFGSRDTHGMTNAFTWGFDGWIHACHGFNNQSEIAGKDGKKMILQSGNTYRMKADGSHAEQFTHGQVNPFGLSFDPLGNLYSADCHSKPVYHLLRNAWYPSFGTTNDGLGLAPEMVTHDHGSTAISGVVYMASDSFPEDFYGNVLIGNVVTNRINRDEVIFKGSTPKGVIKPDFLTSEDPWFRPVDIKLGPDGALYVADFYNKIIGHYEVSLTHPGRDRERGRIWRIVYRGTDGKGEIPKLPDFTKMSTPELIAELGSQNIARRVFATNRLVANGGDEVIAAAASVIGQNANENKSVHAMWVLERLGALNHDSLLALTKKPGRVIRTHVFRLLSGRPDLDGALLTALRDGLNNRENANVIRAAADALGRHPDADNLRPLLDARHDAKADDEALVYVLRQSLRDQFASTAWPKLDDAAFSEGDHRILADVALGAPTIESARYLAGFVKHFPEDDGKLLQHLHHVARHGDPETDGLMLRFAQNQRGDDLGFQAEKIKAFSRGIQERGSPWVGAAREWSASTAANLLDSKDDGLAAKGVELAESLRLAESRPAVLGLAQNATRGEGLRAAAVATVASLEPVAAPEPLGKLILDEAAPYRVRESAAEALAKSNTPESRTKLIEMLPLAPERLQVTIAAALGKNRAGGEALLDAVTKGKASARAVRIWIDGTGIPDLAAKIEALTAGIAPADAKVALLLDARRGGFAKAAPDVMRGLASFTKNCAACHQIAGQGARIGPQLDGIGVRGSDRLVEDMLDPNRNIDQAFRLTTLAMKDGRVVSGLMLREEGDILVLADAQGKEQRIAKGEVEDKKVSPVSPMPADFSEKLPEAEFYDLIAFLLSRKS